MKLFIAVCSYILFAGYCQAGKKQVEQTSSQENVEQKQRQDSSIFTTITFQSKSYFICRANPHKYKIEIFNKLPDGGGVHNFKTLLALKKDKLVFAVNGGMFEQDGRALGLLISNGQIQRNINRTKNAYGNFYLMPNGIFLLDEKNDAFIAKTDDYSHKDYMPVYATQSGPMLVIDGKISTHFTKGSKNTVLRNGVGVNEKGEVLLVVSEEAVNFYEFAELFRDELKCNNALYLDGVLSQYFAPAIHKMPRPGLPLGVFITVSRQ